LERPSALLLEHLQRSGSGGGLLGNGGNDDGGGAEGSESLDIGSDLRARSRGDGQLDALVSRLDGRRPAVDGLAYRPRREAIDLGTDDSVEELRGAFGQFQRAEHESGRSQDQFGTTATERLQ